MSSAPTCYFIRAAYCSLLTAHYSPLTTHYSPLTTHHSPLTTHHSPLTTHYSPLTTGYSTHHTQPSGFTLILDTPSKGNTLVLKTKSNARLAQHPPQPSVTCDDPCLGAFFTVPMRPA